MELVTMTRVDASFGSGTIHRKGGVLIFHSEAERLRWLHAVEEHQTREELERAQDATLRACERALDAEIRSAFGY